MPSWRDFGARALSAMIILGGGAWNLSGQSLAVTHGDVVAAHGDPAPGIPGATFSQFFDSHAIDEHGRILFEVQLEGAGITLANRDAFFFGEPDVDLNLLVRAGDLVPGLPQVSLGPDLGSALIGGSGLMSHDGSFFALTADITGSGVGPASDSVLLGGGRGNLSVIMREGAPASGTGGGVFGETFVDASPRRRGMARPNQVMVTNTVDFSSLPTPITKGIFTGPPLSLSLVAGVGSTLLGAEVSILGGEVQSNTSGQILYWVALSTTQGVTPATSGTNEVLMRWSPSVGHEVIAREGDAIAGIPGVTIGAANTYGGLEFGTTALDRAGRVLFVASLKGAGVTSGINDRALILGTPGSMTFIARDTDPVAGAMVSIRLPVTPRMRMSASSEVAFRANLEGPGVNINNDTALCLAANGLIRILAREGDPYPGTVGARYGDLFNLNLRMNDRAQVVFIAPMIGGDAIAAVNDYGYVAIDPEVGPTLLIRTNDTVLTASGLPHTNFGFYVSEYNNGDGASSGFNHSGDILISSWAQTGPGTSATALIRTHVGSLWGRPRAISQSQGGAQRLTLNAGAARAGHVYLLGGSWSGTSPGLSIGNRNIPLNHDPYFDLILGFPNTFPFSGTRGVLDSQGRADASITLPPGLQGFSGLTLDHAFVAFDPAGAISFVSETASLSVTP